MAFLLIVLENRKIFAKGVGDCSGVNAPLSKPAN